MLNGENVNADKKFFSKIGTNYLIYAILAVIFQIIAINIIGVTNPRLLNNFNSLTIISAICNYILPLPILIYLMKKIESENLEKHSLTPKTLLSYIAIALTLMWIGNMMGLIITTLISSATPMDVSNPVQTLINSSSIWINLVLISIIGPVFEEVMFRKILIDRTIKYGVKVSVLLSALMFGLFHGNLNQFFYAFLIGGFFAYVYIKTGNIAYPIILHMSVNLMGSVISLFVVGSVQNITSGNAALLDLAIIAIYVLIIALSFITGIYGLSKFKTAKIDNIKAKITLTHPFKTVILNYGMILFIGFCILEIIYQMLS